MRPWSQEILKTGTDGQTTGCASGAEADATIGRQAGQEDPIPLTSRWGECTKRRAGGWIGRPRLSLIVVRGLCKSEDWSEM